MLKKIMEKNMNDLTVKETLEISAGIAAVSIAMMGAIYAVELGIMKIQDKRKERREKKNQ